MPLTTENVASATGCDPAVVAIALPIITASLTAQGINKPQTLVGILATMATESGMKPVAEAFWLSEAARNAYFDHTAYGKVDPTTGQRYYGRGFCQLTWKSNYEHYGSELKQDFVNHPELLLQYHSSSDVIVLFFIEHGLDKLCESAGSATDAVWTEVRGKFNGGTNGLAKFLKCVANLMKLV